MAVYPANYPQPTWSVEQEITVYNERAKMECGWSRQRRTWVDQGSSISLEFLMDTATFAIWMNWVYEFGYQYFTIDLDRYGGVKLPQEVRFVTPVTYAYQNFNTIVAQVSGEVQV